MSYTEPAQQTANVVDGSAPPPERDQWGRFVPGNKVARNCKTVATVLCSTAKISTIKNQLNHAFTNIEVKMPEIVDSIYKLALNKDKRTPHAVQLQAQTYLVNRIYGMPNQPISSDKNLGIIINEVEIHLTDTNANTRPINIIDAQAHDQITSGDNTVTSTNNDNNSTS